MKHSTEKRTRATRACQACRRRKVKCNGATPVCQVCQDASQPCVYMADETRGLVFKSFCPPGAGSKRKRLSSKQLPTRIQPSQQLASQSNSTARSTPSKPTQVPTVEPSTSDQEIPSADLTAIQSSQTLSIPFFRWFGPTGIAPGYKRFFVPIKHGSERQDPSHLTTMRRDTRNNMTSPTHLSQRDENSDRHLFEPDDGLTPLSKILFPLLDTFFEYYSCHFPFLSKDPFIRLVRDKKVPAILLNSMCAMAALCSDLPVFQDRPAYLRGEVFCNKAKYLLVPLLNMPSYEVLESILMITWMELATCHDVGLWMYTGMAVRMAEDMGMHKRSTVGSRQTENNSERLLYWAINLLDHIICFAVGRPLTTRREHVDVDLPAERLIQTQPFALASPFPGLIQVIQYQGLANEVIRMLPEQPLDLSTDARARLTEYGSGITAYYTSIHPSLIFNVPNFRAHAIKGQGGTFLLLHLWFNSAMISIHRPGIRFGQQNHRHANFLCSESRHISLSLARTTSSMLSLAELVDIKSIIGSPCIDQPVEVAGLVFIAELQIPPAINLPNPPMMMNDRLRELGHQTNYQVCLRTLQLLTAYWRGLIWIMTAMEQKYQGAAETDPGETSIDPYTSVLLSDRKMIAWLLKSVEENRSAIISRDMQTDATIGIGVAGTMDSASQKTVTIIQSGQQATTYADFTGPLTPNGAYLSDIGDDFVWKSWLDDGTLWNFGLEYLDENVKYGMISGPPSSGVDI